MINQKFLYFFLLCLIGCQHSEKLTHIQKYTQYSNNITPTQNQPTRQQESAPFVVSLSKLSHIGNSARLTGALNHKNGCLYIDDYLIVIGSIYIKWQNDPFWIGNNQGEKFQLGDKVSISGSQTDFDTIYDNFPNQKCNSDKIWLTHGITKPLSI